MSVNSSKTVTGRRLGGDLALLAGILLLALAARIYAFPIARVIAADGISYVNIARSIFRGEGFSGANHFPPLYPLLIGTMNLLAGDDELAGKLISLLMGMLLVLPVYLLGKELFSRRVGAIAALFVALSPSLVKLSSEVLTQTTYLALLLSGLYCLWRSARDVQMRWGVAAGLFCGAAYLTRPEAIVVLAACTGMILFLTYVEGAKGLVPLKSFAVVWAAFFLMASPYLLLLHDLNGTWQLTGKSSVTLADSLGWYLDRPDLKREPTFAGIGYLDVIRQYPDFLWKNGLRNLNTLIDETLPAHVWVLLLLGIVAGGWRGVALKSRLFLLGACSPLLIIFVFFFIGNLYTAPYLPFFFIFAAHGLVAAEAYALDFLRRGLPSVRSSLIELIPFSGVAALVIGLLMFAPHVSFGRAKPYHFADDGARYDHKLIGLMLKKHLAPRQRLMAKDARINFYADMPRADIPQSSLAEIIAAARAAKVRYLVADGTLFGQRPQMEPLLQPLLDSPPDILYLEQGPGFQPIPGLKLILLYKNPASAGAAVYEFQE
jgi:4-amino-4-deoxy-L-arabinose transferase-like glycosyltransferase